MSNKQVAITNSNNEKDLFLSINQKSFRELLTFIDFVDNKLNISFVEIKFSQDRDILIDTLLEHPECKNIQFEILDFSSPHLRFLRDELVKKIQQIKIKANKKLILLITGLEKSIGILEEYPAVLTNLNFVRDDLRTSVPHPMLLFLPEYALTRLAKYAPDFWAWGRKVFLFQTNRDNLIKNSDKIIYSDKSINNLERQDKQSRIELLLNLLDEYNFARTEVKEKNLLNISNIYLELGNAYYSLGEYQKAIDYYQQSLDITQQIGDKLGEAKSLRGLGNAYYSLGEYQQAIDYHQQSLEITQEIGDIQGEASSLRGLGNAYHSLGEYQQAINFYQHSLKITQEIDNTQGEASSLRGLGNAYYSLGEYQQAIDYHQQSLEITQEIGDIQGEASSLNNLGLAYKSLRKYQQAIDFYQQSLEIKGRIGDIQGEAKSLNNLGLAYKSLGEYQQAIDFYQQSLEIAGRIGDRRVIADTWFNLGLMYEKLNQPLEAKTAYENARELYQAMGLDKQVENCHVVIQDLENDDS